MTAKTAAERKEDFVWFKQFLGLASKKLSAAMDLITLDMLDGKDGPSPEALETLRDALDFGLGE